jgi:2-iminobutanoate/2-iminopropanoate deaminase
MAKRQTLELPNVHHGAPIPMGCRVGNVLHSSAIMGADPETGKVPTDGAEQVRLMFVNLRTLLELGGASTDDIVFMNVLLQDNGLRDEVNKHWLSMFPDPEDRPARHTTRVDLPGDMLAQVEIMAVI